MNRKVIIGWTATMIWGVSWATLLVCDWTNARNMTFNEWGDFFAGAFAPLAFLWLVIGYFQQGDELSQNTKALEQQERALQLQVKELKQSVEQQTASALALRKQSEISGLMAELEGVNHITDSLERQIKRIASTNSAGASAKVKELQEKLESFEARIESILGLIEDLEENKGGHE